MAAKITHILKLPVGTRERKNKVGIIKEVTEYREIGSVIEYESEKNGNRWSEILLNLDILNPQLFTLARAALPPESKSSSTARVRMYDPPAKRTASQSAEATDEPPAGDQAPLQEEDDIPF